jgi:hypothetical protein
MQSEFTFYSNFAGTQESSKMPRISASEHLRTMGSEMGDLPHHQRGGFPENRIVQYVPSYSLC